jgi:transcriptional regulator with GAF, ATPase, and Fis domain
MTDDNSDHDTSDATGPSLGPEESDDDENLVGGPRPAVVEPAASPRPLVRSSTDVVDAALRLVTALADATVDNADGVSVTLERHGRLMTVAASNDKVLTMDRHQYETGEGPCLDAKANGRWYYIESLDDETRWPTFVPLALSQGIHSILSSPLMTSERPQGALNIYSSEQHAFGKHEQELAALFADQASEILTTAGPPVSDEESNRRFAEGLATRRTIHQAQGVIMARDNMTEDEAIRSMFRAARAAQLTVLSYAMQIVASTRDDGRQE